MVRNNEQCSVLVQSKDRSKDSREEARRKILVLTSPYFPLVKGGYYSFDVSGVALMGIFSRSRIYRFANGAKLLGNFADVAPQQNSHTSLLLN